MTSSRCSAASGSPRPRRAPVRRGAAVLLAITALGAGSLTACEGNGAPAGGTAKGREAPLPDSTVPRDVAVVQLPAVADSASAVRLRDSLVSAGWTAMLRSVPAARDSSPWRVRVAPGREPELVRTAAAGFAQAGVAVQVVDDRVVLQGPNVAVQRVSGGTAGMAARVRWLMGPGGRSLIAVEDPAATENGPLPDGFIYANENGAVIQRDSVWDVAPDPGWRRLAYGAGFLIPDDGEDSTGVRQWARVATRTNMDVNAVRRAAFRASDMSVVYGFAQPVILPTDPDSIGLSPAAEQVRRPVPLPGGWRVRWTRNGRILLVGRPPERHLRDDSSPVEWLAVNTDNYLLQGLLPPDGEVQRPSWTQGPVLDVSVPVAREARRLAVEGGAVVSRDGWITIEGGVTAGRRRIVGPGVALAATARGRVILALAPDPSPAKGGPPMRTVIYRLLP